MTGLLPAPRAVLYDWDNTLVDSWAVIIAAFRHTLETFGHPPWGEAEARRRIRKSLRDSFPDLFGDRWMDARDVYYGWFEAHHIDRLRALPGAAALLAAIGGRGVYQAVVSNKTGRFLRAEAAALDWGAHFGALVGSADADRDKPDPSAVEQALAPSGIEPGPDVWFIGDTDIDMECAHRAGLTGILIGAGEGENLGPWPVAAQFGSCQILCGLVDMHTATISVPAVAGPVFHTSTGFPVGGGSPV